MKCFVTGASGFIGFELTKELIKRNYKVNVMVRSELPEFKSENLTVFKGDLSNVEIIHKGMKDCDYVFHLAAYANIWSKDKKLPYKTNVEGTKNILECALQNKIKRVVFTSSAAVFAPSLNSEEIDEQTPFPKSYLTDYESTKLEAEMLCRDYVKKGLEVIIVNPSRVFGPGLLNKSNSVTILIKKYIQGKWRILPGSGMSIGNYVFIDDVVNGQILALQNGVPGERYILGGTNISLKNFFSMLSHISGLKFRLYHLPYLLMMLFAQSELAIATIFGKNPMITPAWLRRYMQNRALSSQKAIAELKYTTTPLSEGILKTIIWINSISQ